jgi:hypothetical protein
MTSFIISHDRIRHGELKIDKLLIAFKGSLSINKLESSNPFKGKYEISIDESKLNKNESIYQAIFSFAQLVQIYKRDY